MVKTAKKKRKFNQEIGTRVKLEQGWNKILPTHFYSGY